MDDALLDRVRAAVMGDDLRSERAGAVAGAIRVRTGARWVGVYTVSDGIVSNDEWSGPAPPAYPSFATDQGLTAHAIATRAVAVSNDVAHDPRYLTNQSDSGSELIVPIILGGEVVGTLDVEDDQVGAFDGIAVCRYEALAQAISPLWNSTSAG